MAKETVWLRAVRMVWWLGAPILLVGWLLTPRESIIYVSQEPFSIEINTLRPSLHPILGELLAQYRVTGLALIVMIMVTAVSHVRRTNAVRSLSLLLPTYVAAIEACAHFSWVGRRHSFTAMPTLQQLRRDFHAAAAASVVAVVATVIIAAVLARKCRAGVAGRLSSYAFGAVAPVASVVVLWSATERLFFGRLLGPR
jgi:hypothetical protein